MTKAEKLRLLKTGVLNVAVFALLAIFALAEINGRVSPFLFAFLFASIYIRGTNAYVNGAVALFASLFRATGRTDVFTNVLCVAIYFLVAWCVPRFREKFSSNRAWNRYRGELVLLFTMYALTHMFTVYFALGSARTTFIAAANAALGAIFLAVSLSVIYVMTTRANKIPWTSDQKITAGTFAVVVGLGFACLDTSRFGLDTTVTVNPVFKSVAIFAIMWFALAFGGKSALCIGLCAGLGGALRGLDLSVVAVFGLISLVIAAFRTRDMVFSAVAALTADVVLGIYFAAYGRYGFVEFVSSCIGVALALVVGNAFGRLLGFRHSVLGGALVSKNTINRNRAVISTRLENMATVFNEMQNIYKNLVQGTAPIDESAKMLARGLAEGVCGTCPNRPICRRDVTASEMVDAGFERLCQTGLQKKSVDFLDLPPTVTAKCTRVNAVLNIVNRNVGAVVERERGITQLDATKVLMAGLLSGTAKLFKNFASDACSGVVFDVDRADEVKSALLRIGIVASDVLLTQTASGGYMVSVLVPRLDARNPAIEDVIAKILGHKMNMECIDDAETAGFAIVTVRTAPRYNLTFGVAQVAKDYAKHCGDTFTFLKISNTETLMAVVDGMGAGEKAQRASVLALSLVENFYKAGFPNEVIMESVNQLLLVTDQECFSAVDIAVFSLNDGLVNFIKVGGVEGYIKRAREVEVIEAGSLPIGIVEEMAPKITRAYVGVGDMVILASDGVADSFGNRLNLGNYINNTFTNNPQKLADEVIAECLRRKSNVAIDDLTVIVAQIA